MWTFFDFENNWTKYHLIWQSDYVQDILKPSMEKWCETEAYLDISTNSQPIWKPKSDLWTYSRTDFHCTRISERTDEHIHKHNLISKYNDTRKRLLGYPFSDTEILHDSFHEIMYDGIYESFEPKKNSWEANILVMGANYLSEAQVAAFKIFDPNSTPYEYDCPYTNSSYAILPESKIVIDFQRAFMFKIDPKPKNSAQNIVGKYFERFMELNSESDFELETDSDSNSDSDYDSNSDSECESDSGSESESVNLIL